MAEQEIPVAEKEHTLAIRRITEKYNEQVKALDDERAKRIKHIGELGKAAITQAGQKLRDDKRAALEKQRQDILEAEKKSAVERLEEHDKEKEAAKKLADAEKKAADILAQFKANPNQDFNAWNAGNVAAQRAKEKADAERQRNIRQAQDNADKTAGRIFDGRGRLRSYANNFDIGRFAEQTEYLGFDNVTGNQLQALRNKRDTLRNKLFNADGTMRKGVSAIGADMGLFKQLDNALKKADAVQEAQRLKDEAKNREKRRAENEDKRTQSLASIDSELKRLTKKAEI